MPAETYFIESRKEILPFLPTEYSKVLEIGCGEGIFSTNLIGAIEVWGIEPDENSAAIASKKIFKVFNATYEKCFNELPENYFNLVICNDVIEHMPDYNFFFQSIKKKMTANGCLVGSIPNVRYFENIATFLIAKDWKYSSFGILDYTHLRFFTKKSLLRSIKENGYTIEKVEGIHKLSLSPFSLWRLIKWVIVYGVVLLTLGYYKDIVYLQFGFRIRPQ